MARTPLLLLLLTFPFAGTSTASAQSNWVDYQDVTATSLQLTVIPLNDDQEKDIGIGDFDKDGDDDIVIFRKLPFSNPGAQINVLLMNEGGVLIDRTSTLAPDFLIADDARDVLLFDADGDGWEDMVTASTFGE